MDVQKDIRLLREHFETVKHDICQKQVEERTAYISDIQRLKEELASEKHHRAALEEKLRERDVEIKKCHVTHDNDAKEWRQFQADLQKAVKIANDFRTKAEHGLKQVKEELLNVKRENLTIKRENDQLRSNSGQKIRDSEIGVKSSTDKFVSKEKNGIELDKEKSKSFNGTYRRDTLLELHKSEKVRSIDSADGLVATSENGGSSFRLKSKNKGLPFAGLVKNLIRSAETGKFGSSEDIDRT